MIDLFVLTADADMLAVIEAVLNRPRDLGICPITFRVDRHTGRDPGMVKSGPELLRILCSKTSFKRAILIWDHHGSGWERKEGIEAADAIQLRLNGMTWKECSAAIAIEPEIEEWLWHDSDAIGRAIGATSAEMTKFEKAHAHISEGTPKEKLHLLFRQKLRRGRPLPGDFHDIASCARLRKWESSPSFCALVTTLRHWFPAR